MTTKLDQLKQHSSVVADTGNIEAIKKYQPVDATTNPTLVYQAVTSGDYNDLINSCLQNAIDVDDACDRIGVKIGCEILNIIPGRISTEVNARLSFNVQASIDKARKIIGLYEEQGFGKDRILIKLAATWEGIKAAEQLEREGINCNLTLIFSMAQAIACAEAGVYLISPFVGRILDWNKNKYPEKTFDSSNDPGVTSVKEIFQYYKSHNYNTVVMAASFRNIGEIEALTGCDRLTISPALLDELANDSEALTINIKEEITQDGGTPINYTESDFRFALNENEMATEKLSEGIRKFVIDQENLENYLKEQIGES
jgi:transaldolase